MQREEKKQKMVKMYFLKLLIKIFENIKKLFMGDLLSNGLHKKVMICYIIVILLRVDYTYSFLKKSSWKWSLANRWKKRGMIKINNGFYI